MAIEKGLLAFIITAAIGIIVLPSTVSLFSGQHDWYYLDNPTSDVPCQKCHADIYAELNLSSLHIKWGDSAKADTADCEACHRGNSSVTYTNASAGQPGLEAHAATRAECSYCHFNTSNMWNAVHGNLSKTLGYDASGCRCHNPHGSDAYGIAGGFGLSNLATDTGLNSTHFELLTGTAFESNVYPDESEACIFCHADVGVKFNFTTYTEYSLSVRNSVTTTSSEWSVTDISATNFTTYTEVK
jgi:hypothetical protein